MTIFYGKKTAFHEMELNEMQPKLLLSTNSERNYPYE